MGLPNITSSGQPFIVRMGTGNVGTGSDGSISTNQTYRFSLWYPPTGTSATSLLYVNGALAITSSSTTLAAHGTDTFTVGVYPTSAGSPAFAGAARYSQVVIVPCTALEDVKRIILADYNGHVGVIS